MQSARGLAPALRGQDRGGGGWGVRPRLRWKRSALDLFQTLGVVTFQQGSVMALAVPPGALLSFLVLFRGPPCLFHVCNDMYPAPDCNELSWRGLGQKTAGPNGERPIK
jgi:hypothetical protein